MIIKLKGANFSTNNINALLNSYFVSITGGSCVTATNNISSVSKDSATYSNTFTVNTDYSVSNVEVTMGGNTVTSGVNINGSTISISIPTVTGNISIKFIYTYNGAVVEPDTPTTDIILFNQEDYTAQPSAVQGVALADNTMELIRNKSIGSVKVYAHSASDTFRICKVSNISDGSTNTSLTTIQTASLTTGWNTITFSSPVTFSSTEWLVIYDDAKTFGYSSTAAIGFYTFDGSKWTLYNSSSGFGPTIVIYQYVDSGDTSNVLYSNETYISSATGSEAVLFSDSTMNSLRGKNITAIKVYAHSASSTFKIIKKSNVSNNLAETTPIMTTIKTASLLEGWNTITFESPITLSSTEWLGMYDEAKTYGYTQTSPTGLYVWNTGGKKWTSYPQYAPTAVVYGS